MKLINKVILGSIFVAQTASANYKESEMNMHYNEKRNENINHVDFHEYHDNMIELPVEFHDDLDEAIEEEDKDEEDYLVFEDAEEEGKDEEDYLVFEDAEEEGKDEEDYLVFEDVEEDSPVKLRGSSNMTNAKGGLRHGRQDLPATKNYGKQIENGKCFEYLSFNVGPIWGQAYYASVLAEWSSRKPGSDAIEAGWRSTGHWNSVYGRTSYVQFKRGCPGYFKLPPPAPISCPDGSHIKDKDECIKVGLELGGILRYNKLVSGSWTHVPYYCSIQSGGDMSIHFNTKEGNNDGKYSSLCAQPYN